MNLNLIVIKTHSLEAIASQYKALGLEFTYHNHGAGPFHYSAEIGKLVFEIYPLSTSQPKADNSTRLGFEVNGLEGMLPALEEKGWIIKTAPKRSEWGFTAIIQDLDGRKVELKEGR